MIPLITQAIEKLTRQGRREALGVKVETYRFVHGDGTKSYYRVGNQESIEHSDVELVLHFGFVSVEFFLNGKLVSRNAILQIDTEAKIYVPFSDAELLGFRLGENELVRP